MSSYVHQKVYSYISNKKRVFSKYSFLFFFDKFPECKKQKPFAKSFSTDVQNKNRFLFRKHFLPARKVKNPPRRFFVKRFFMKRRKAKKLLRGLFVDADPFIFFALSLESDNAVDQREKRIVSADSDVIPGVNRRSALSDQDIPRQYELPVRPFGSESFRVAFASVSGTSDALFVGKKLNFYKHFYNTSNSIKSEYPEYKSAAPR
jgi:hypothetical protein